LMSPVLAGWSSSNHCSSNSRPPELILMGFNQNACMSLIKSNWEQSNVYYWLITMHLINPTTPFYRSIIPWTLNWSNVPITHYSVLLFRRRYFKYKINEIVRSQKHDHVNPTSTPAMKVGLFCL
jgi:hypothetical protein